MPGQRGDQRAAARREKQRRALELRKGGATYEQIATALKMPGGKSGARKLVARAIQDIIAEPAADVLALELERLDALLMAHWEQRGDPRSARIILDLMARRARYLGLDAPARVVAMSDDATPSSPEEAVEMARFILAAHGAMVDGGAQ